MFIDDVGLSIGLGFKYGKNIFLSRSDTTEFKYFEYVSYIIIL